MKINFNIVIKGLDNNPVKDNVIVNEIVAHSLLNQNFMTGTAIKKWELALKIYNNSEIDIDTEDLKLLKAAICANGSPITIMAQGQILKYLETFK